MNWSSRNSYHRKEAALANGAQKMSGDKINPPMLQASAISVTWAANQLEADWWWYSSATHNLNTKIVVKLYNQVLKKIKVVVRILSWMAVIMTKIWRKYDEIMTH